MKNDIADKRKALLIERTENASGVDDDVVLVQHLPRIPYQLPIDAIIVPPPAPIVTTVEDVEVQGVFMQNLSIQPSFSVQNFKVNECSMPPPVPTIMEQSNEVDHVQSEGVEAQSKEVAADVQVQEELQAASSPASYEQMPPLAYSIIPTEPEIVPIKEPPFEAIPNAIVESGREEMKPPNETLVVKRLDSRTAEEIRDHERMILEFRILRSYSKSEDNESGTENDSNDERDDEHGVVDVPPPVQLSTTVHQNFQPITSCSGLQLLQALAHEPFPQIFAYLQQTPNERIDRTILSTLLQDQDSNETQEFLIQLSKLNA